MTLTPVAYIVYDLTSDLERFRHSSRSECEIAEAELMANGLFDHELSVVAVDANDEQLWLD